MATETTTTTRRYFNTGDLTIGRACILAAGIIAILFALGVITNTDKVSWGWLAVGLFFLGQGIG